MFPKTSGIVGPIIQILLIATLGALLVSAGIEDVRTREIANWKNAAIALLAPGWWWASGLAIWPDMAVQLAIGFTALVIFAIPFAWGAMGGGDVKLIAALGLWLPFEPFLRMMILMSLVGGGVTLVLALDRLRRRQTDPIEVPYGIAIAIGALLVLREPILNQFP